MEDVIHNRWRAHRAGEGPTRGGRVSQTQMRTERWRRSGRLGACLTGLLRSTEGGVHMRTHCNNPSSGSTSLTEPAFGEGCQGWTLSWRLDVEEGSCSFERRKVQNWKDRLGSATTYLSSLVSDWSMRKTIRSDTNIWYDIPTQKTFTRESNWVSLLSDLWKVATSLSWNSVHPRVLKRPAWNKKSVEPCQ